MPRKENLQPLLDVRQNHLGLLFGTNDALDAKLLGVIGFSAAVLIFGLDSALGSRQGNPWWLCAILVSSLITSIIIAIVAIWPENYSGASVDIDNHPEYLGMSEDTLVLQLIADTQESIERNIPLLERKADRLIISTLLAIIGMEALLACIIKV